jgi:lipopolysaccharide export system protein LptA
MPFVERLRRWLAVIAVVFSLFVAGVYVRGRMRQSTSARPIPPRIDSQLKRTASGFEYAKSEGGRTIFVIRAGEVKEFKLNGRTALRKVSIILYGRDSSRFDRIYGDDFAYDPQSGDVTADGDVQIDLEANPAGLLTADQAPPADLKNPIHLKTSGLVFNRNTGNASTDGRVEFTSAQGSGWAQGVRYEASSRTLTLAAQIHVIVAGPDASVMTAARGTVSGDPRQLLLEQPRIERGGSVLQAATAMFVFGADNNVERILASGAVHAEIAQPQSATGTPPLHSNLNAERAEFVLSDAGDQLHSGLLTGHVQMDQTGPQPMQANAERVQMEFSARGVLQRVKAEEQARIHYGAPEIPNSSSPDATNARGQGDDYEIAAQAIDFDVTEGGHLDRAVTSGPAQITLLSKNVGPQQRGAQRTVITAGRFESRFAQSLHRASRGGTQIASVHGEPDARIVSAAPGQPERVSTSQRVDAEFSPEGQLTAVTQQGTFHYSDGAGAGRQTEAFAGQARYTVEDQFVTLTGNPRVAAQNMTTTAQTVRINRVTGEAFAQGEIKSTYTAPSTSQATSSGGALLGSQAPVHVTASAMRLKTSPSSAVYTGSARLWQDANMIEAPEIEFDNAHRTVRAKGNTAFPATMTLVQNDKAGKSTPVRLSGMTLTYTDSDRTAIYEGGVTATGRDFTASAKTMKLVLVPAIQVKENKAVAGSNRVERMVASGVVNIEQMGRKATGEQLVYTPADEKFVLTGGPPSIFDAERGKITGDSLTFYRHDARVLVEGEANSPVVTQTQVAR